MKSNTNENPYPPGPTVAKALAALKVESLRRYPPPTALPLRKALAALHNIGTDNLLVTNGPKGKALAEKLGDKPVALMRGHGMDAVVAQYDERVELD